MKGEERRKQLLNILSSSNSPVSGGTLSKELNVSRQIIVQDISLLRANGATIFPPIRAICFRRIRNIPGFSKFSTQTTRWRRNYPPL